MDRVQSMHQTILKVQNSLLIACCKNMLMYLKVLVNFEVNVLSD